MDTQELTSDSSSSSVSDALSKLVSQQSQPKAASVLAPSHSIGSIKPHKGETININIDLGNEAPQRSPPSQFQTSLPTSPPPAVLSNTVKTPGNQKDMVDISQLHREREGILPQSVVESISAMSKVPSPPPPHTVKVLMPQQRLLQLNTETHHKHLWISLGIALGVIVVIGVLVLVIVFHKKHEKK